MSDMNNRDICDCLVIYDLFSIKHSEQPTSINECNQLM